LVLIGNRFVLLGSRGLWDGLGVNRLIRIVLWCVYAVVAGWSGYVFLGPNRHAVIAGEVYRSAQPSGAQLDSEIAKKGIKTVVNLRGHCPDFDWYREEVAACERGGAGLENVMMSAKCLPAPADVRKMIALIDSAPRPMLIHCKEGKDRTGLMAVMVRLLTTDDTLPEARRELWPLWGHFPVARTQAIDDFFDRYERWLAGTAHTKALFRDWAVNHYLPGVGKSTIEVIEGPKKEIALGTAPTWTVRVTNRSTDTWFMTPGSTAGVHLGYSLRRDGEAKAIVDGKAGLMRKVVKVGMPVELTVALPPMREPGRFTLLLEMMDYSYAAIADRATPFTKYGDDAVTVTIDVR
jgi:protein tyrosine phosphatase (PTP) superfamily phosphohydrolase (DUF442 family)